MPFSHSEAFTKIERALSWKPHLTPAPCVWGQLLFALPYRLSFLLFYHMPWTWNKVSVTGQYSTEYLNLYRQWPLSQWRSPIAWQQMLVGEKGRVRVCFRKSSIDTSGKPRANTLSMTRTSFISQGFSKQGKLAKHEWEWQRVGYVSPYTCKVLVPGHVPKSNVSSLGRSTPCSIYSFYIPLTTFLCITSGPRAKRSVIKSISAQISKHSEPLYLLDFQG